MGNSGQSSEGQSADDNVDATSQVYEVLDGNEDCLEIGLRPEVSHSGKKLTFILPMP